MHARELQAHAVGAIARQHAAVEGPASEDDPDHRVRASATSALWSFGELRCIETVRALLIGEVKEQVAGCRALGDMVARVRNERLLVDRPLLAAALRQAPRYAELNRLASGR